MIAPIASKTVEYTRGTSCYDASPKKITVKNAECVAEGINNLYTTALTFDVTSGPLSNLVYAGIGCVKGGTACESASGGMDCLGYVAGLPDHCYSGHFDDGTALSFTAHVGASSSGAVAQAVSLVGMVAAVAACL